MNSNRAASTRRILVVILVLWTSAWSQLAVADLYTVYWGAHEATIQAAYAKCEADTPHTSTSDNFRFNGCRSGDGQEGPAIIGQTEHDTAYWGHVVSESFAYYAAGCPTGTQWSDVYHDCIDPTHPPERGAPNGGKGGGGGGSPGNCPDNSCGNPINTATGNKHQLESDFVASDLLRFERSYNSEPSAPSHLLGPHWVDTYHRRIETISPTWVVVWREDGAGFDFNLIGGTWQPRAGVLTQLVRTVDGSGNLTGWKYLEQDAREIENFDSLGRLTSIIRSNGESVSLVYNYGFIESSAKDYLPTTVTDQSGRRLSLEYDTSNRLVQLTDPAGATFGYSYDSSGRLSVVTYPGSATKTYLYNEAPWTGGASLPYALTGILDEKSQRFASFGYQADGRATSTEHAGGVEKFSMVYNSDGTTSITKPSGVVQERGFDRTTSIARTSSIGEAGNGQVRISSYTIDSNGKADVATDPNGVTTDYDYDARGLETQRIESANQPATKRTTQTDWDTVFHLPLERRLLDTSGALESKSAWTYNSRGQILTASLVNVVNSSLTRTTAYTYCEPAGVSAGSCPVVGLLLAIDGPRSDVVDTTTYTYRQTDESTCGSAPTTCPYRKGDLWKVTNAAGQVAETVAYDAVGRPRSIKDANGVVTDVEYNARGWLTAQKVRGIDDTIEADDAVTRLDYDATGMVTKATQPDGDYLTLTYDAAHRLTDVTDALGNSIHYSLNSAGQRIEEKTKDSGAAVTRLLSRVYDTLGQLQTQADAYATPTDFTYDVNGQLDTSTDPLSRVTNRDLDALGRLAQVIANVGGSSSDRATTQFQYDARDNLRTLIDPKGLSTAYTYDSVNNLTQLVSPDTGSTSYGYDLAGNRTSETKADNVIQNYAYDALGRLTAQTFAHTSQNIGFIYDATQSDCFAGETYSAGQLTKETFSGGSTRFCYDIRGNRVRQVQSLTAGTTLTVTNTYTASGRLQARTYPSGAIVTYLRNANGEITRIDATPTATAPQAMLVSNVAYVPFGPLQALTFGNGRMLTKAYDLNYGIDKVSDSSANHPLFEDFTLDAVGNVTRLNELRYAGIAVDRAYDYDGLDRVTAMKGAIGGTVVESISYDATGDRLSHDGTAYSYEATSHRLTSVGADARSYNASGDTLSLASGTTTKTFTYDDRHRLATVRNNGALKLTYIYNARGERVAKQPDNVSNLTQFVYDESGHLIGEYSKTGVPQKEYVWLDDTLVAVLSSHDGSTYQYVETDHLGTPRLVIRPSDDEVVWRWALNDSIFGESLPKSDPDANGVTYMLNVRFPGQYYDNQTGLNYNYFRDYDPGTGRYLEPDPIGLAGGMSMYGYVGGNPLGAIDPRGLHPGVAGCAVGVWAGGPLGCSVGAIVGTVLGLGIVGGIAYHQSLALNRPSRFASGTQESIWDKTCAGQSDTCAALKAYISAEIIEAQGKMRAMHVDKDKLYVFAYSLPNPTMTNNNRKTWLGHGKDLEAQRARILEALALGRALGCDVSKEAALASTLYIPLRPGP